jgi:hypothetical protein
VIASAGIAATGLGLVLLAILSPTSSMAYVIACLALTGIGFSLFSSPNVNAIMSGVDKRLYGVAGGVVATMRVLGQLASMGLVATAFALTLGRVEIIPAYYPALAQALGLCFMVAAALCVPALLCSLTRGRMR